MSDLHDHLGMSYGPPPEEMFRRAATYIDLFETDTPAEPGLRFGDPPSIALRTQVPEDVWGAPKKKVEEPTTQIRLLG